jgi:hypothetical protein
MFEEEMVGHVAGMGSENLKGRDSEQLGVNGR